MLEKIAHEQITELRLARPPVNALDPAMLQALTDALDSAVAEKAAGVVLSGAPGMFSAGLDVPALLELDRDAMRAFWRSFFATMHRIASCPVPIGAAITGHCPAAGMVFALFCDLRIAAQGEFKLGLNEVRVGLPVPPVVYAVLVRQVGLRRAEQLAVRGALLGPADALDVGMVDQVLPVDEVVSATVERVAELASLPRAAMTATRRGARSDLIGIFASMDEHDHEAMTDVWFDEETQAALRAMVAKLGSN